MNKNLKNKKLFLLDQDGTLYKGNVLFKATPLFLDEIKKRGGRYVLITNNTSTSDEDYIKKLDKLGIKVTKEEFFTAAQATVIYLNRYHKGAKVFLVGTESFRKYLVEEGINLVESKDAEVVLLSYDRELTYQKLWDLSELLTLKDIPYIATNPDLVCPTTFGFVPDCGSFAHMIKNATGKTPHFIGKPSIEFFRLALLKMNATVEKIKKVLRKSPFGSGELAADFLPWSTEEELKSAEDGLYVVEADDNVEARFVSPENKDYPYLNRGISWRSEIRVPYEISNGTLMVVLGCGVHSAIYQFNRFTGELVDVVPDGIPSDVFYADGKAKISHRRQWLLSCSQ